MKALVKGHKRDIGRLYARDTNYTTPGFNGWGADYWLIRDCRPRGCDQPWEICLGGNWRKNGEGLNLLPYEAEHDPTRFHLNLGKIFHLEHPAHARLSYLLEHNRPNHRTLKVIKIHFNVLKFCTDREFCCYDFTNPPTTSGQDWDFTILHSYNATPSGDWLQRRTPGQPQLHLAYLMSYSDGHFETALGLAIGLLFLFCSGLVILRRSSRRARLQTWMKSVVGKEA